MKTNRLNTPAAWMLAGLAILTVAGNAFAEEAGRVTLGDLTDDTQAKQADDSDLIIRGQSDLRRRNARSAHAMRRFFKKDSNVQQTGMFRQTSASSYNCDSGACCPTIPNGCCPTPPSPCAVPSPCAAPACAVPAPCCPPPVCAAPDACFAPGDCCPTTCDGCDVVGTARISDACSLCNGQGCSACGAGAYGQGGCKMCGGMHGGIGGTGCPICDSKSLVNNNCFASFMGMQAAAHRARNRRSSANLNQYLRCRLGYFVPTGGGGSGVKPFGHYEVVYPADAAARNARDGSVYAAQGYGGPVSVPVAPNVRHAYNYGWGIPSSRLTPISNTAAQ